MAVLVCEDGARSSEAAWWQRWRTVLDGFVLQGFDQYPFQAAYVDEIDGQGLCYLSGLQAQDFHQVPDLRVGDVVGWRGRVPDVRPHQRGTMCRLFTAYHSANVGSVTGSLPSHHRVVVSCPEAEDGTSWPIVGDGTAQRIETLRSEAASC